MDSPAYKALHNAFMRSVPFAHRHPYEIFSTWLTCTWSFLNAVQDPEGFRATLDAYTREQGEEIGHLFNLYTDCVEAHPFEDVLGCLFMELDIHSVRAGQFFTPYSVAVMMARMQFSRDEFQRVAEANGCVTVCDPACGSGVMLLAFASVVHAELGWAGVNQLKLYGQDIDERCVNMARIQIRMNGLDALGRTARMFSRLQAVLDDQSRPAAEVQKPLPTPPPQRPAGPPEQLTFF